MYFSRRPLLSLILDNIIKWHPQLNWCSRHYCNKNNIFLLIVINWNKYSWKTGFWAFPLKLEVVFQVTLQKTLEYLCQKLPEDECDRVSVSVPNTKLIFSDAVVAYTELRSQNATKGRFSTHFPKWILNDGCLKQKQIIIETDCFSSTLLASWRRKKKELRLGLPGKWENRGRR